MMSLLDPTSKVPLYPLIIEEIGGNNIGEDVTIPSGTNGLSTGPVSINSGFTVTVNGEWEIV